MPENIQIVPEVADCQINPFDTPLPMTYTGSVGAMGVQVSQTQVQLRADNSPFAEAALFIATVPENMRADALAMMKEEQKHRHQMEEQDMKNDQERAMDIQEKNFQLNRTWMKNAALSDFFGKILAIVVLLAYFGFLGFAIYINNATAINALTGAGIVGLILTCIGHMVKGKREQKSDEHETAKPT